MDNEAKYVVEVIQLERAPRTPKELQEQLKGLGRKTLARMKKEAVDCPVLGKRVPFLQCYFCKNFIRRVYGKVYCKGLPLT